MKATLIACASSAALLFAVSATAGEPDATAAAAVETPSDGAPVQDLADPTAGTEATVEGEVAPEGEGDIDADADADAEATVEGEVAPEGEGDIDADAETDAEADAEAPVEAPPEAPADEPNAL